MGLGDDLMFLGAVQANNQPVRPTRKGRPRAISPLWHGEQLISTQHLQARDELKLNSDGKYKRPYHHCFGEHTPISGKVHLTEQEHEWADQYQNFILLCCDPKPNAHHANNKSWPWWQELADILHKDYNLLRVKHEAQQQDLHNVTNVMSPSIRHSYGIVKNAKCVITTEGFWHHSSASHNTKCLVIYGGTTSPKHLGYKGQLNIVSNEHGPCYSLKDCEECHSIMKSITAEYIASKLYSYLK